MVEVSEESSKERVPDEQELRSLQEAVDEAEAGAHDDIPEEELLPVEIMELDLVVEELRPLAVACEFLMPIIHTHHRDEVQLRLKHYATALTRTPKALQVLNDIRRHIKRLEQEASDVRDLLIEVRGGEEDAMTSEETRIIVATASIRETVITAINNLEAMLSHIRNTAHPLITLISHEEEGFLESAQQSLPLLRPDLVSTTVHQEMATLKALREDLLGLYELRAHAEELANA